MTNPHQRDKNEKPAVQTLYTKDAATENGHSVEARSATDNLTTPEDQELSGSEFLLAYAGMFSSGTIDTSERIEDQRDFRMIRPKHCPYFEILP